MVTKSKNGSGLLLGLLTVIVAAGFLLSIGYILKDRIFDDDLPVYNITDDLNLLDNQTYNSNVTLNFTSVDVISQNYDPLDETVPGAIRDLNATQEGVDWILWEWTNPLDPDFKENIIYLDGINVANTTDNFYQAIELVQNRDYTITVYTVDTNGNINEDSVSDTESIDTLPPSPIKGLVVRDRGATWIEWIWINPSNDDFKENIVFVNGGYAGTTEENFYIVRGLTPNTQYEITVYMVDEDGNIDPYGISDTSTTCLLVNTYGGSYTYCLEDN